MKRKIHTFLKSMILFGSIFVAAGCSKFDQDFSRNPIGELKIEADETEFNAVQFEELRIPIKFETPPKGDADYSYRWRAIAEDSVYVISRQKDLDITLKLPVGEYNLQYTIIDKTTGLEFNKLFQLTVNGAFFKGWLVSHNTAEQGKLSFVRADGTVFDNPAVDINNKVFPGKAISSFYSKVPYQEKYACIHYYTDAGIYRFDPNSFLLTGGTDDVLPKVSSFSQIADRSGREGYDKYIINNGELYAGMGSFYPEQILRPYSEGFGGDYRLYPAIISTDWSLTYFYDNKYKRFLQAENLGRKLLPATGNVEDLFDKANVGKTMIAAGEGKPSYYTSIFYFVMEDHDGRYLYGLDGTVPSKKQKIEDVHCPRFSKASSFAVSSVFDHMYYAVDNELYLYNIMSNTASLLYRFPSSQKISDIENDSSGNELAVSTVNNKAEGVFHIFKIDEIGHFVANGPALTLRGFGDIVHISQR